jgi:predicted negative regulator of RcsB-dependent stress response
MTSKHKEHIKSLKGPDQFQVKVMSWLDWGLKNVKLLGFVVAPLIVIAAGWFGYQYFQNKQRDARLEELGKAQIVYEGEQRKANDARQEIMKKVQELDAKAAPDKDGKTPPADPKVQAEKDALTKQAEAIKADHTASTTEFLAFYKKYDGTPEGWMAGMTAARLLLEKEKLQEARPILENVLSKSKDSPFYQTQARLALIGVLEEQGEYDAALTELDQLDKVIDKDLKPKVLLARGRLQLLKNSKDDAKATFNTLIETHGTSPEAQKARSIQALLN